MGKKTNITAIAQKAQAAALEMATVPNKTKTRALKAMAAALKKNTDAIVRANQKDLAAGKRKRLSPALLDRLMLDRVRIQKMARAIKSIARLKDPVGKIEQVRKRPQGFALKKVRVPIGVVAIIYEARPNVTGDAAALGLKSGNAVILKGGSEAIHSNNVLVRILAKAAYGSGIPRGAIGFVNSTSRQAVKELLVLD